MSWLLIEEVLSADGAVQVLHLNKTEEDLKLCAQSLVVGGAMWQFSWCAFSGYVNFVQYERNGWEGRERLFILEFRFLGEDVATSRAEQVELSTSKLVPPSRLHSQ